MAANKYANEGQLPKSKKKQRNRRSRERNAKTEDFISFAGAGGSEIKFKRVKAKRKGKRGGSSAPSEPEPFRRSFCCCQATIHTFWANCTECGYILCDLEKDGECFHCWSTVIRGQGTFPREGGEIGPEELKSKQEAVKHRDDLLRFNRESERRTMVRSDDFWEDEANNLYLSKEERTVAKEMAQKTRKERLAGRSKKGYKLNLDLKNMTMSHVVEEEEKKMSNIKTLEEMQEYNERLAKQKWRSKPQDRGRQGPVQSTGSFFENNALSGHAAEVYASLKKVLDEDPLMKGNEAKSRGKGRFVGEIDESSEEEDFTRKKEPVHNVAGVQRVPILLKTKGNDTMGGDAADKGVCLSMHQPWASLLVYGIKRVEGRTWSTEYRGRMWIAAAKRMPAPFEIEEVENQYCKVFGLSRKEIPFPAAYPTACLLGAVDLVDAKPHDEYMATKTTREESSSDHVFLCSNPRVLMMPGQCSGEHKLWRIPADKVKLFQGGLRVVDSTWIPEDV